MHLQAEQVSRVGGEVTLPSNQDVVEGIAELQQMWLVTIETI